MTASATQRQRLAELKTPLGVDVLLLSEFHAQEALSAPFEVAVDCVSHDKNLDFAGAIGLGCSIRLNVPGKKKRYFHGVLTEAAWYGEREFDFAYRLTLRPWFWLLTQTTDCRIFQNLSVVDIIKAVFEEYGFRDYEFRTNESYPALDYCVWYRESAFNFVSRLMEKFGIYYFFRHAEDKHVMVMADSRGSHDPVPNLPSCRVVGSDARMRDEDEENLTSWIIGRSFQTGKVSVNGFDFAKPNASLLKAATSPGGYAHDSLEVYDYPEKFKQPQTEELAGKFAQARLLAAQSLDRRREGRGYAPSLFAGGVVKITNHPIDAENTEFLVVSASHSFRAEQMRSGGTTAASYSGRYLLQPGDRPFKAPAVTPHPVISGPQTAIVVGPSGEEIHTDKYGRIKVKFHWDRRAPGDERSSRWVRVAQIWSGKAWGGIVIPRIGMEVVIEFIEGDPDRPLVIGTVYNGENDVPFSLPGNKTQSGMRSRSTKQATDSRYNELVFEDKKDVEFVRFHAEKDLLATVEDKESRTLKGKNKKPAGENTRETTIEKGDDSLTVATGDHNTTIGRHQTLAVGVNRTASIGANEAITIGANQAFTVGQNVASTIGMSETRSVGAHSSLSVGSTMSVDVGKSLKITVGASSITMTTSGIVIDTPHLKIKTNKTDIKAAADITLKGAKISQN